MGPKSAAFAAFMLGSTKQTLRFLTGGFARRTNEVFVVLRFVDLQVFIKEQTHAWRDARYALVSATDKTPTKRWR
jgi:hypothetical protein